MYDIHACHPGSICALWVEQNQSIVLDLVISTTGWGKWSYASNSRSLKSTHRVRTGILLASASLPHVKSLLTWQFVRHVLEVLVAVAVRCDQSSSLGVTCARSQQGNINTERSRIIPICYIQTSAVSAIYSRRLVSW
jgi:hypothetical protein